MEPSDGLVKWVIDVEPFLSFLSFVYFDFSQDICFPHTLLVLYIIMWK